MLQRHQIYVYVLVATNMKLFLIIIIFLTSTGFISGKISEVNFSTKELKIMCLGDSITLGTNLDTDDYGYRNHLQDNIGSLGIYDFVGPISTGIGGSWDKDHAGFDGEDSGQILDRIDGTTSTIIDTYLPKENNSNNAIFWHVGSNEFAHSVSVAQTQQNVEDVINYVNNYDQNIKIFVALAIPKNTGNDINVTESNVGVRSAVVGLQTTKHNLYLIDMNQNFRDYGDFANDLLSGDGIHPKEDGFIRMADVFINSLKDCQHYQYCETPRE